MNLEISDYNKLQSTYKNSNKFGFEIILHVEKQASPDQSITLNHSSKERFPVEQNSTLLFHLCKVSRGIPYCYFAIEFTAEEMIFSVDPNLSCVSKENRSKQISLLSRPPTTREKERKKREKAAAKAAFCPLLISSKSSSRLSRGYYPEAFPEIIALATRFHRRAAVAPNIVEFSTRARGIRGWPFGVYVCVCMYTASFSLHMNHGNNV